MCRHLWRPRGGPSRRQQLCRLSRQSAVGHGVVDHPAGVIPERGRAVDDVLVARDDAVAGHAVFSPRGAFGQAIEQHGLEAIHGGGESSFRCGAFFKFVPECAEVRGLIVGEKTEDAIGGPRFALMLIGHAGGVVGKGVAGVDFHEVVDDHHFQDTQHIERLMIAVLGEDDDEQRQVPGVFGIVLLTTALCAECLAEYLLQFIDFGDETNLPGQAVEVHAGRWGGGGAAGERGVAPEDAPEARISRPWV